MHSLFRHKTFRPFFLTQFLGAFNDNVFKNALVIFITYQAVNEVEAGKITGLAGALFIAPYIFFSMLAGQLSDRYEKAKFIKQTKVAELIIMLFGALGFWLSNVNFLLFILFLMGTQSTFFGPAKYSILPQVFKNDEELVGATSYVEMGTFFAILIGTIGGGVLIGMGSEYVSMAVVFFAFLGWFASVKIPKTDSGDPSVKISLNPLQQAKSIYTVTLQNKSVFVSILLVSWFWFFGAIFLQQIAVFVRHMVFADKAFVTVFLSAFTLSLSFGSFACNFLSNKKIELALIPIGALGMSLFAFDLSFISYPIFGGEKPLLLSHLLESGALFPFARCVFDFFSIGFFGSLYIVPLYAMMQRRSDISNCSQVIASNNIINSVFMIASSIYTIVFYSLGYNTTQLLASVGILNLFVLGAVLLYMPEFWHRFYIFIQSKFFVEYDTRSFKKGMQSKGAVIVGKKESIFDLMALSYFLNKPIKVFENLKNKSLIERTVKIMTCYTIFKRQQKKINDKKIITHLDKNELVYMNESAFQQLTDEKRSEVLTYCKENKIPVFFFTRKHLGVEFSRNSRKVFFFIKKRTLTLSLDSLPF